MLLRPLCAGVIAMLVVIVVTAQSVTVRPRNVVYKRTAKTVPDFKRTFEVRYPMFSGRLKPIVLQRLRSGTDYWKIFNLSLAENLKDEHWLSSFDYDVVYNKNNILDIALTIEGIGAYPDGSTKHRVFDLRTGQQLAYANLFAPARLNDLLATVRAAMKVKEDQAVRDSAEVREVLDNYRRTEPAFHPAIEKLQWKDLDGFSIGDDGVKFFYDYKFAHVVQALEPFDEVSISYQELKPFIRTDGLLARFVR